MGSLDRGFVGYRNLAVKGVLCDLGRKGAPGPRTQTKSYDIHNIVDHDSSLLVSRQAVDT